VSTAAAILTAKFPAKLVSELLECYIEQKKNLALGHLRPTEVEGGRFAEAAFRMLEHLASFPVTPLNRSLDTDKLIIRLANLPFGVVPDSVRLHIPRTLRVIYDIRNNRDAAHLADGIDPNVQDAYLVSGCLDWVLAELLRLSGGGSPADVQRLIEGIAIKRTPAVEEYDSNQLKTLRPGLGPSDRVLLLLYSRGSAGASSSELLGWLKPSQRANLNRLLTTLEHEKDLVVRTVNGYRLTKLGVMEVEKRGLSDLI
jgi:hypothetical protein